MVLGGLAFIWLSGVVPIAVLPTLMFSGMDSFPLLAIPFFVIAGDVMQRCGILPNLIAFANSLVGHRRGGLAYVVIVTSMLFAGVTGVALAECAAIGSMLAPAMVRQGYPGGFVSSVIAGSAVMGPIIPPSVAMLIYAYVYGGGISVGKLFLMGVVPGVLVAVALMALVWVTARQRHFPKSDTKFSLGGGGRRRGALCRLDRRLRAPHPGAARARPVAPRRGQDERHHLPAPRHVERRVVDPGAPPGAEDRGPVVARADRLGDGVHHRHHHRPLPPRSGPRGGADHDHAHPGARAGRRGLPDRPPSPRVD